MVALWVAWGGRDDAQGIMISDAVRIGAVSLPFARIAYPCASVVPGI
jgi:hypothetical protein